ncbi:hypothetical protein ACIBG7_18690 [Nonomuraea sp. NPDC050328]|uniref:hypothetical protein n=1 Tax=Nonomuraea sp. NPDC050328 TaxID=3364361 RepID=UPI0037A08ECA
MTTHPTIETLEWISEYWPDLLDARLPMATRRPWRQSEIGAEARAVRDAEARLERILRTDLAPGETPSPLDVTILQTAFDLLVDADDLAGRLADDELLPKPPSPGYGSLDIRPYLDFVRACLVAEHEDLGEPGEWAGHAHQTLWRMYETVARTLGMAYTGQTVRAVCPWCSGRTAEHPEGGQHTWLVVEMPGDQIAIMCTGQCEPPQRVVGTWWSGQPCWPITQWDRLARYLPRQSAQQVTRMRRAVARRRVGVVPDELVSGLLTERGAKRLAKRGPTERQVGEEPRGASGRA